MAGQRRIQKPIGPVAETTSEIGRDGRGDSTTTSGIEREETEILSETEIETTDAATSVEQPFSLPGADFAGTPVKRKKRQTRKPAKNTDNSEPLGAQVCDALEMLSAFLVPNGVAMTPTERRMITKAADGIESEVAQRVMKFAGPVAGFGALIGYGIRVATTRANVIQVVQNERGSTDSTAAQATNTVNQSPIWQQPKHESESKSAIVGSPLQPSVDVAGI